MKTFELQIPVAANDSSWKYGDPRVNGGGIFLDSHHEQFLAEVKKFAKGYSKLPIIEGVWINDEGEEFREEMIPIRIATDDFYIDLLAKLAKKHYDQESIFVLEIGTARFY